MIFTSKEPEVLTSGLPRRKRLSAIHPGTHVPGSFLKIFILSKNPQLSFCFKESNTNAYRQIQAPRFGGDGNSQTAVRFGIENEIGQSARLAAEDQHVADTVANVGIRFYRFFGEVPAVPGKFERQVVPIVGGPAVEIPPVIHSGPGNAAMIELESQRFDQEQTGPAGHASSSHGSRIIRDFRLVKNNVQIRDCFLGKCHSITTQRRGRLRRTG